MSTIHIDKSHVSNAYVTVNGIKNIDICNIECPICHTKMRIVGESDFNEKQNENFVGGRGDYIPYTNDYRLQDNFIRETKNSCIVDLMCDNCNAKLQVDVDDVIEEKYSKVEYIDTERLFYRKLYS